MQRLPFLGDDMVQPIIYLSRLQRSKSELGASGLHCRSDFVDIIADHAEPGVAGVLLDHYT